MASSTWNSPAEPFGDSEVLPELDVPPPGPQRRWTVLLRWLLLIPQFIVLALLSIVAFFVTIAGWFGALVLGKLPEPVEQFLAGFLAYQTRVGASAMLLVDRYPPFAWHAPDYPAQIELHPTSLNRLAVFFRIILMIPAAIVNSLLQSGWYVVCWVFWLIGIVLGRLPRPVYDATAAVLRWTLRFHAYTVMLTPAYPKRLFGDEGLAPGAAAATAAGPAGAAGAMGQPAPGTGGPYGQPAPGAGGPYEQPAPARSGTRPLLLGTGAKVLVVLFLLLGLGSSISSSVTDHDDDNDAAVQVDPAR